MSWCLSMTKKEVFRRYCEWIGEDTESSEEELFANPVISIDVNENADIVVNHLYFLIAKVKKCRSEVFLFCEVNTFAKHINGDLELIDSTYFIK